MDAKEFNSKYPLGTFFILKDSEGDTRLVRSESEGIEIPNEIAVKVSDVEGLCYYAFYNRELAFLPESEIEKGGYDVSSWKGLPV